jgi:hypothetical protein
LTAEEVGALAPSEPDQRAHPMTEFDVGDRVRVRNLPASGAYAGRVGAVVWAARSFASGPAVYYQIHLDDDPAHFATVNHVVFGPADLESEATQEGTDHDGVQGR